MPHFDLPLAELRTYRSTVVAPDDLDDFWSEQLGQARSGSWAPTFTPHEPGSYGRLAVDDVTFSGAQGHPVRAWFIRPRAAGGPLPCIVQFVGYGGGRGRPIEHAAFPATGYATLVMDTRGQGGLWTSGDTGDPGAAEAANEHPGVMTRGLDDPRRYYYSRLYVDAVRALETAREHPEVDEARVAVAGGSQGGALALAAAALAPDLVRLCLADIPFLCDIPRGVTISPDLPYRELALFLRLHPERVETAHRTLAYVDCAVLAPRIQAQCLLSVGLMDTVCPPSTVFAAYNAIEAAKEIAVLEYAGHEVLGHHLERQLIELAAALA